MEPIVLRAQVRRLQGSTLYTTHDRAPFTVELEERAVIFTPHSTGRPRRMQWHKVEHGYALGLHGSAITPTALRAADVTQYNPAYLAALLRALDGED